MSAGTPRPAVNENASRRPSRPPLRGVLAAVCLALAATTTPAPARQGAPEPPQQSPPQQQPPRSDQVPSFKAGIEVVSLNVTVTTDDGRYVTNLSQEDFSVFEDGVKQDIRFFNRSNLPLAEALLLDTSASMDEKLPTAQEAAAGFARRLRPEDIAQLIVFGTRVEIPQPFTNSAEKLEEAIRATTAGGSTALFNAIYVALTEMKRVRATRSAEDIRREAIVILSDGDDTTSLVTFEQVLDLSKRSETVIYAIGLRSQQMAGTKGFKQAEHVLREITTQTGGRVFFPERIEDLASVYTQIAEELSSQYLMGYMPKNARADGGWRRVVVRVDRPEVSARTKQGYYAPRAR